MSIVVLTGAKKNLGDYLIESRLVDLIKHVAPGDQVQVVPRWESAEPKHAQTLAGAKAVFFGGGPFVRNDIFSSFPVLKKANELGIVPRFIAGGWKAMAGSATAVATYSLDSAVRDCLKSASKSVPISVRDVLTYVALQRNGVSNVTMTGCSVWYDMPSLGKSLRTPSNIKLIGFSTPEDKRFFPQAIALVRQMRAAFPQAAMKASFNRGITVDANTSPAEAAALSELRQALEALGVTCEDAAYAKNCPAWYDEADFHFGYRLHTHLYYLSKRIPSYLLNEDGRGHSMALTLNTFNFDAFSSANLGEMLSFARLPDRAARMIRKLSSRADMELPALVVDLVKRDVEDGCASLLHVPAVFDRQVEVMRSHLRRCIAG